jgi:hypothetical protein
VELAISALEQNGIPTDDILAVPLDKRTEKRKLFDTIHQADGFSMFDAAAIMATIFMLLGAIYGYVLEWGPILWGIIGAAFGGLLGFLIRYMMFKRQNGGTKKKLPTSAAEVIILLQCEKNKWETVEKLLWDNFAIGVARVR